MIKINTAHITEEGLPVEGTESSDILELRSGAVPPIEASGDIRYHLYAVMAGQDLLVTGTAEVPLKTECVRCLAPMELLLKTEKLCLHFENAVNREIIITDDIREELLLAMPQNFHCSEDCKGICPHCGANLNREECRCAASAGGTAPLTPDDSPWLALDDLKK